MKSTVLIGVGILAAAGALASASADDEKSAREKSAAKEEVTLVKKSDGRTETIRIKSAAEIDSALDLAAREGGGAALDVSCSPPDHDWCANGFQAACAKNEGGLSTNPDGSITCSMPD